MARYERRGVKVINLPGNRDKYGEILAATFRELREYIRDNTIAVSKVTEERPLRELLLPRDASNRLCFFSLPLELLPFYRERVFPVVEEVGFVPVTADDVVTPGDTISAKIDTLIDRSSVMVAELTSSWKLAEYRMAIARIKGTEADLARRRQVHLIVVLSENEQVPPSAQDLPIIRRPNVIAEDSEEFIRRIRDVFLNLAAQLGLERPDEPRRLLDAKEYRAAVISAMTLLESKLRERLNKSPYLQAHRPLAMRPLIELGIEQQVIPPQMQRTLDTWMRVRNEAVHSAMAISRAQATEIVNGVNRLIGQMAQ